MPTAHQQLSGTGILSESLLRVIVCPVCKGFLTCDDKACQLHCATCKLFYPIRDRIPILLVRDASPASNSFR